ncbi:uncharacterized protein PHACADRAFT_189732 [Phanerochaete carnosa HHB-10118-sp]|uniref:AAA+ ATPase domain-containing protein n=1 Tax=Phanerochaete carnosa (strain HHB-10118-sp) TaxID=650164 RepID=K5WMD2_PHACS|nr:uncharacterized protein PHACADRAFT_189732 [Phanerochaete carnosa HHB-10118-sp]EKM60605.1 hypothetical protein PHACADRAFT_189732 [Phanerochaete carnosa HHB-10118-sp]
MSWEDLGNSSPDIDDDWMINASREILSWETAVGADRVAPLATLSSKLFERSVRRRDTQDLEDAICAAREAISICPLTDEHSAALLHLLASPLLRRFELAGQPADVQEALSLHRKALFLRPSGHAHRYASVLSLLHTHYCHTGEPQNSIEYSSSAREALSLFDPTRHDIPGTLTLCSATPKPATVSDTPPLPLSKAEQEWQRQKDAEGAKNSNIDTIMEMTGLEEVKAQMLRIKAKVDIIRRQGASLTGECFNIVLRGNPGAGKTTVARHYVKFLASVDLIPDDSFIETTGSRLANSSVREIKEQIEEMLENDGGAIFIDEAYQFTNGCSLNGRQVLDFLLGEMEKNDNKIVFIFAGYNRQMETFFEHNPGLISRVPYSLQFNDFNDLELLHMLEKLISKKYNGQMKVEGGVFGLYMRVAVRRLGRGRGKEGFGNARALQTVFATIFERQAMRLTEERKKGESSDDFFLAKEDIIGPNPSKAVLESVAWKKLHELVGLAEVKRSIKTLFDLIAENYKRELAEKQPIQMSLNRVFLGNPGTGKTLVAKLYGQILEDLGLLSNGEVLLKNPADFVGSAVGESERNTKAILAATAGKVLVIDEAYSLYGGGSAGGGKQRDQYRTAVIDTIVAEVQSVPGEDRCVLMCGYEQRMREMFQNVNPGLSRRFAIEDAFRFEDFSESELLEILNLKLKDQDLDATPEAKAVAIDMLSRARDRPHFGNGGEVENMLGKAKNNYQSRQSKLPASQRPLDVVFEPVDFDSNFNRAESSDTNLRKLFKDMVGCEKIVEKLQEYQNIARVTKLRGREARKARHLIPTNFVFKGPPGTGKTTTARRMGQVYYDMGFLSSTEVVECSASELVGQYVGQTGPKTRQVFERALGKVLFIDEAYRLSEGAYAKEAVDELVGILTQEAFVGKLVVVIAGYDKEMDTLLAANPGLASRFPEVIHFENMSAEHCLEILRKDLAKDDIECAALGATSSGEYRHLVSLIGQLSSLGSWGNARDMKILAQRMVRLAFKCATGDAQGSDGPKLPLSSVDAVRCVAFMFRERSGRAPKPPSSFMAKDTPLVQNLGLPTATGDAKGSIGSKPLFPGADAARCIAAMLCERGRRAPQLPSAFMPKDTLPMQNLGSSMTTAHKARVTSQTPKAATQQEEALPLPQECNPEVEEQCTTRFAVDNVRKRKEMEFESRNAEKLEEEKKEQRAQKKLKQMGLCSAGYEWVKQTGGYRCKGGSHWVSDSELGM